MSRRSFFALNIGILAGYLGGGCGNDALGALTPEILLCAGVESDTCGSPLSLGSQAAGLEVHITLGAFNRGDGVLRMTRAEIVEGGEGLVLGDFPEEIGQGQKRPWPITLTPPLGEVSATIAIDSNDAKEAHKNVVITYRGDPCIENDTTECGIDTGACSFGTTVCIEGVWQPCEGDVGPIDEACNGDDDDCDGEIDNGATCDDGIFCNGAELCIGGACEIGEFPGCGDPVAYPELNGDCSTGVCDEDSQSCVGQAFPDGEPCDDGSFCNSGEACQGGACQGGVMLDCSAMSDSCNIGVCDESRRRCQPELKPGGCECTAGIDDDFDGADQCLDCDDRNGRVYPDADELCNGLDDDCDTLIDEDFDGDTDTYSTCAIRPEERDCDDGAASVHPGAPEICDDGAAGQTGNGVDEDCDGYIDEGCQPCNPSDAPGSGGDGDGISECAGDCAPTDASRYPGQTETCDGVDNDCNIYTVDNCDVSDECNFDQNGNPADDADVCKDDLLCACIVNNAGSCTGDYRCTSYCNGTETGTLGDLCDTDETCSLSLLRSTNVHGCSKTTTPLGTGLGGQSCKFDSDCKSLSCVQFYQGGQDKDRCMDACTSDAYCQASNTVCRVLRSNDMHGICWPAGTAGLGTSLVGQSCSTDTSCDHGVCTGDGGASKYCTKPCCSESDCATGYSCSLGGDQVATSYVYPSETGPSCTGDPGCPGGMVCYLAENICAYKMTEASPMCLKEVASQGTRRAGAACTQSSECISNYCSAGTNTCVESCCDDSTCPLGLSCELQLVETVQGSVSWSRVCVNQASEDVIEKL